jgi:hypothetical protein
MEHYQNTRGEHTHFNVENVNLRGYKWNETVSNRISYVSNRICDVSNEICNNV